ncbi:MAG TPA: septal ring lytic transglycosylase RlpA family protein [Alphaproteobacteria bacterium]
MRTRTILRAAHGAIVALALAGCAETNLALHMGKRLDSGSASPSEIHGAYKIGNPYQVEGVSYTPREDFAYDETGIASWYGPGFHARRTANGAVFDQNAVTGAHPTLQLPVKVQVTNLENGRSIAVLVNDRGPFKRGRIMDLSRRSAQLLGFEGNGTARVRVRVLPEESLQLAASAGRKGAPPVQVAAATQQPVPMPRGEVTVAALPPPANSATPVQPVALPAPAPVAIERVRDTGLYVQAGAFLQYDNADRLRLRLSRIGPAAISPVERGAQRFFRVRIGPIATVAEADRALDRVIAAGHAEARLVVD